jgi:ribosome-associated protein
VIPITSAIAIAETEITESFVRASGPGGQNVNKLATAVQLRFDLVNSPSLPDDIKARLRDLAGSRVTEDGVLIIDSRRFRTQKRNREDAMERLVAIIRQAAQPPPIRYKTRPTLASKLRRLDSKRRGADIKRGRGRVDPGRE